MSTTAPKTSSSSTLLSLRNALSVDPVRSAKEKRDLLEEFRSTTLRGKRGRIFAKLLRYNLTSRNITLVNALVILPRAVIRSLDEILSAKSTKREAVNIRNVPRSLQLMGISPDMIAVMEIIIKSQYKKKDVFNIVMDNTKSALAAMVMVQVLLAIIQTVTEIGIFNKITRRQDRHSLETFARAIGVRDASTLNMDQLRITIAKTIVESASSK